MHASSHAARQPRRAPALALALSPSPAVEIGGGGMRLTAPMVRFLGGVPRIARSRISGLHGFATKSSHPEPIAASMSDELSRPENPTIRTSS